MTPLLPLRKYLSKPLIALFVLAVYFFCSFGRDLQLWAWPGLTEAWSGLARGTFNYLFWFTLVPFVAALLLLGWRRIGRELGLDREIGGAFLLALFITAPMLVGYAVVSDFSWQLSWGEFVYGSVEAAFCEEFLFRAFLFGLLYRQAGWGLLPATLIDGLVFGALHLYQGDTFAEAAGIFLVTGAGGVWFSWLYKEWNFNLWLPVFLHFFMNFSWMAFDMADNALGGWLPNIFRGLTIGLSVWLTVRRVRRGQANARLSESSFFSFQTSRVPG